jgi:hypothetical protein
MIEHGHSEKGPRPAEFGERDAHWIALGISLLRRDIGNMNWLLCPCHAGKSGSGTRSDDRIALPYLQICGRQVVQRRRAEAVALAEKKSAELGLADAHRSREQGLEHGLQIAWRASNDAQHL